MQDDIRERAAALLRAEGPPSTARGKDGFEDLLGPGREWLRKLAPEGLGVPTWPGWCGGRDATAEEAKAIRRVLATLSPPDLYPFSIGTGIVGPTMLAFAGREQQERWLPPIARGDEIFCQMFSEPDAGSDLANVSTLATPVDDGWELRGQKVWTSRGSYADWGLCLARTQPEATKHAGLAMFIVDMTAPGVVVRPLEQLNGDQHFSEVFLDGVHVGADQRIGEDGTGWKIAMTALAHERASIAGFAGGSKRRKTGLPDWLEGLSTSGALADPVIRQRAMHAYTLELIQRWAQRGPAAGGFPSSGGSGGKLRQVAAYKARVAVVTDAAGAAGLLTDHVGYDPFLIGPSMSIRGGTDEIQRNVIGERILGLPAEPKLDRDVPWVRSRRSLI